MKAVRHFLIFTLVVLIGMNFAFASSTPPVGTAVTPTGAPIVSDAKDGSGKNPFSINFTIGFPSSISDKNIGTPAPLAPRDSNLFSAEENISKARIYQYGANAELGAAPARHHTNAALKQAMSLDVDLVYIHLNAFADFEGAATDVRNKLSEFNKPMTVFIDNGSKGSRAIISTRADSSDKSDHQNQIQTSVYSLSGNQFQEKYKTYVNSIVTKAAKEKTKKESLSDSENAGSNSKATAVVSGGTKVSGHAGVSKNNIVLYNYRPSLFEKILDFLLQPFMSFLLICLMGLGLLLEFRRPGSGFPLFASVGAALLLFVPLHMDGFADAREIVLFFSGVILMLCKGIWPKKSFVFLSAGACMAAAGLVFCLSPSFLVPAGVAGGWKFLLKPLALVSSAFLSLALAGYFLNKFFPVAPDNERNETQPVLQTLRSSG